MLAIAHRYGNNVDALRAAVSLGADVIETDVHLHRGRLEIRHEKSLGPLPWYWDKWRLLPGSTGFPTLGEVLAALPHEATVMLDLKGVGQVGPQVRQALASAPRPVLVCARWWPSSLAFSEVPEAKVLLSARSRLEVARVRRRLAAGHPPYGVSVHLSMLTPALVREVQAAGTLVFSWPVDDPVALARARELGIDGAITKSDAIIGELATARREAR